MKPANNPNFNITEFSNIKTESGSNGFVLTTKHWREENFNKYKSKSFGALMYGFQDRKGVVMK